MVTILSLFAEIDIFELGIEQDAPDLSPKPNMAAQRLFVNSLKFV